MRISRFSVELFVRRHLCPNEMQIFLSISHQIITNFIKQYSANKSVFSTSIRFETFESHDCIAMSSCTKYTKKCLLQNMATFMTSHKNQGHVAQNDRSLPQAKRLDEFG